MYRSFQVISRLLTILQVGFHTESSLASLVYPAVAILKVALKWYTLVMWKRIGIVPGAATEQGEKGKGWRLHAGFAAFSQKDLVSPLLLYSFSLIFGTPGFTESVISRVSFAVEVTSMWIFSLFPQWKPYVLYGLLKNWNNFTDHPLFLPFSDVRYLASWKLQQHERWICMLVTWSFYPIKR